MAKRRRPPPDSPDPPDDDRVKFPFGETGSQSGAFNDSESDLFGSGSSTDGSGLLEPDSSEEDLGSDSQRGDSSGRSESRLPGQPPDSDPSDDLDTSTLGGSEAADLALFDESESADEILSGESADEILSGESADEILSGESADEGLSGGSLEDLVELDSSEARRLSVSDRIGPTNPSGPLVIVDDGGEEASSRYQASIVDDSSRLAGSTSSRKKKASKKKTKRKRSTRKSQWEREAYASDDSEVPFPEQRSKPRTPPPPRPSKAPLVVVSILALLLVGGVGAGLEMRRRADLEALRADYDQKLREAETARETASQAEKAALEAERLEQKAELEEQKAALERERRAVLASAEEQLREAAQNATAEAEAQAKQAQKAAVAAERERLLREQQAAIDVELARVRSEREGQEQERLRVAVEEALETERAASQKVFDATLAEAKAQQRRRVRQLKKELRKEREAAASRAQEDDVATSMAEDQKDLLDSVEGGEGGSVSEGVDDWDEFFDDDGTSSGGDGDGGGGDDDGESALHPLEQAYEWFRENVHGSIGYKSLSHFSTGPNRNLRTTRHEVRAKIEYRPWLIANDDRSRGLKLVIAADIRHDDNGFFVSGPKGIDDDERRRPALTADELSLALTIDWFEVKGGWLVFSWGTGDLFNPTDNLNPIDFSDQFDARRIPVLAAVINLDFDFLNLELITIPTFTRTRLPLRNRRFDTLQGSVIPILRPDDPDAGGENVQFATRASTQFMGWDVSISAFHGFNDLPEPRFDLLDPGDPSTLVIAPIFDRITVAGADFATTLGIFGVGGAFGEILNGIQLHGEIAHFWNDSNEVEDYAQYVIGFNYQWVDLILEHDVQLTVEYAGDYVTQETDNTLSQLQIDRSLRGAVLGRIVYSVNEDLSFEINAGVITHGQENALIHPAITWTIADHIKIELASDMFFGHSDTFFGQYRRDRRVTTQVSLLF